MSGKQHPTKAFVAAAGLGKRMRPLTATTPKPLIEVCGKSLIDHGLDALALAGTELAVVNVHYIADLLEAHVLRRSEPEIIISDERDELLETGGGTVKGLPHLGDEAFFYLNADSIWIEGLRPNFTILADAWDEDKMDALLLLSPTVSAVGFSGAGDFTMDSEGHLARRRENIVAPYAYASAAIFHPRLFKNAPDGKFSLNVLFDQAIEADRLFGVQMDGTWLHVGTPEAIDEAERAIRSARS
ncbi:MAG: nucleotidyltransferase family protein [Hyphomicrobiales bacterium]